MTQANAFTGIDRSQMPQVSMSDIEELLDLSGISWKKIDRDPHELRPTQTALDDEKVANFRGRLNAWEGGDFDPILVSRDLMILDGHHRWAAVKAAGLKAITTVEIDLPWQEGLAWLNQSTEK